MNRLKELRKSKNLTIRELADKTHIAYSSISCMETETRPFTQSNLEILCKYFDVTTDYMLGRSETKTLLEEQQHAMLKHFNLLNEQQQYIMEQIKKLSSNQLNELINYIDFLNLKSSIDTYKRLNTKKEEK